MLQGQLSPEKLLQSVKRHKRGDERELALAEAWFAIGQRQWAEGQRDSKDSRLALCSMASAAKCASDTKGPPWPAPTNSLARMDACSRPG